MKTLILDNYDSFTFNLYQEIGMLGSEPEVHRNDKMSIEEVRKRAFTHLVIGPGPGNPTTPRDIGISPELLEFAIEQKIPLLGVCLGHQFLGHYFGGKVTRVPEIYHGKASKVTLQESSLFTGLPETIEAMRYHSLRVEGIESPLKVTGMSDDGVIMALEHESLPIFGVQFHPESIGTPTGMTILKNFLSLQS